jgi:pyruvate,water dikinase
MSGFAMSAFASLERLCIKWLGDKSLALELITGLPGIHSAEIGISLWRMSQQVKSLGLTKLFLENDALGTLNKLRQCEEARPLMEMFDDFLTEHGQRCPNEGEWLNPRWVDAPEQVIELIKGYFNIMTNFDKNSQEMQQRRETLIRNMYTRLNIFQRPIIRIVLRRAQRGVIMRDHGKSHAMKATYPARKLSTVIGERWVKKGWLKNVDDIFFLTIADIQNSIDNESQIASDFNFHSMIEERRKAYEHWFTVRAPDSIGPDGQPLVAPHVVEEQSSNTLHGIPVSAGFIQGRVRVILDPFEAIKMKADEILVTHSTDTGWSVVFPMIAGLITEIGGQLSHAAILARECRLPTIVNVAEATTKLKDGMLISLDCSTGLIHINSEGDSETPL